MSYREALRVGMYTAEFSETKTGNREYDLRYSRTDIDLFLDYSYWQPFVIIESGIVGVFLF